MNGENTPQDPDRNDASNRPVDDAADGDTADTTAFTPVPSDDDTAQFGNRGPFSEPADGYYDGPADGDIDDDSGRQDANQSAERSSLLKVLTANPLRTVLGASVVGALVAGAIVLVFGFANDRGNVGGTGIGEAQRLTQNAFTQSVAGDCLDWPAGNPGEPTKVACETDHRFEVAGPLDTALLPGTEFGESAQWPGADRFATIRDEQCPVIVETYLKGRLDPQGRFSVGLMYPSEVQWGKGARELRCGLQETGPDGQPQQFAGRVAEQDQSLLWAPATCIGIDPATRKPTSPVNCNEPHAFQTTGTVDLASNFGGRLSGRPWPNAQAQNTYLQSICPVQAERFLGGKEKLDATTLNVQWSIVSEPSWLAGSRKVVCYLGLPDRGGFATLVGDARSTLLINGKLPAPPPAAPDGRAAPTPVPLPEGVAPNPQQVPAPSGG